MRFSVVVAAIACVGCSVPTQPIATRSMSAVTPTDPPITVTNSKSLRIDYLEMTVFFPANWIVEEDRPNDRIRFWNVDPTSDRAVKCSEGGCADTVNVDLSTNVIDLLPEASLEQFVISAYQNEADNSQVQVIISSPISLVSGNKILTVTRKANGLQRITYVQSGNRVAYFSWDITAERSVMLNAEIDSIIQSVRF